MEQSAVFLTTIASSVMHFLVFVFSLFCPFPFFHSSFNGITLPNKILTHKLLPQLRFFKKTFCSIQVFLNYTSINSSACRNTPKSNFNYLHTYCVIFNYYIMYLTYFSGRWDMRRVKLLNFSPNIWERSSENRGL